MSTSHFKMIAKSSLTFTPNLPTNTNTYYCAFVMSSHTCPVLFLSVTFHSRLRLRRICSTNETFTLRANELIDYLYKRGYNRYFLQRKYNELTSSHGHKHLRPMTLPHSDKTERVHFVISYNPTLRSISSIIRKHFHILISSPRCYNVFKAAPIVAYRRGSNLCDFLVRATSKSHTTQPAPPPPPPPPELIPMPKKCLTCKYISDGQTSYTFHSTGETRPITHHIDCN